MAGRGPILCDPMVGRGRDQQGGGQEIDVLLLPFQNVSQLVLNALLMDRLGQLTELNRLLLQELGPIPQDYDQVPVAVVDLVSRASRGSGPVVPKRTS